MNITKERAKEILNKYKKDNALFNWCEEYKDFVDKNVLYNMTMEVGYILKKSYEDEETPFNYEDIENINYTEEEIKKDESYFLKDKNQKEQEEYINGRLEEKKEVLCWYIVTDYLKYELEQQKEVLLNEYWGRQTFGQSCSLDSCIINAFINKISRLL